VVEGESIKLLVERSASKEEERPPKERLLPTKGKKRRGEEEGGRGGGGSDIPPPPKTSGASKFSEREHDSLKPFPLKANNVHIHIGSTKEQQASDI